MNGSRIVLLGVPLLLAVATGCGAAQLDARYRRSHLPCAGHVEIRERVELPGVFDASGCGEDVLYRACVAAARSATITGPTTIRQPTSGGRSCRFNLRSEAIQRFAQTTACPAGIVRAADLTGGQLGLSGCERRQVFVSTVSGWILSSDGPDGPGGSSP